MAAAFAFLGILLMSLVVALLAALQIADFFGMTDEFVALMGGIAIFAAVAMTVFGTGYSMARQAQTLNWIAFALAVAAIGLVSSPRLIDLIAERTGRPGTVGIETVPAALEILLPALLIVLVQWGLVRRRWLRVAGEEDLSPWPWVTTVVAGLAILNPIGLALVWSALRQSSADWLREIATTVTVTGGSVLVVMGVIECYIRGRMLRRRLARSLPQVGGEAATPG